MPEKVVALTQEISQLTSRGTKDIHEVTRRTKTIAINAMIEASRIGALGKGFAVVAQEIHTISEQITTIADGLQNRLSTRVGDLAAHGNDLVRQIRGTRLVDLASNMIDIVDRNLYERSCDVRWWATDAAVVEAAEQPSPETTRYAAQRLGVILGAYTVYLDLWIVNLSGRVVATGRQSRYPAALSQDVSHTSWFQDAINAKGTDAYAVADIVHEPTFSSTVATYAAPIRTEDGRTVGVLGIFFDWAAQSRTVVDSVRLAPEEKAKTRCMILDSKYRVIASTQGEGVLTEVYPLKNEEKASGSYTDGAGRVVGFFRTVGYETYKGLGWYGVIVQQLSSASSIAPAPPSAIQAIGSKPLALAA